MAGSVDLKCLPRFVDLSDDRANLLKGLRDADRSLLRHFTRKSSTLAFEPALL